MNSDQKIRVVIVDDIAETRENIRRLLQFENDVEVVGMARTGREGVDVCKETKPDVVLMDINMPDMDGITATETIRRNIPHTQTVILSVQGDPNYMRRAMLAGARDFLTKPPSVDDLTAAIRRAGKMAVDERAKAVAVGPIPGNGSVSSNGGGRSLGKIISVYGPKGGVGTTTVAVNLAMALHNEETPVILVDGNLLFGDVTVFLNEQAKNSVVDLTPRAEELDHEVVREVLITHAPTGVKILAGPPRPEYAESVSGEQFSKLLDYLRMMFSYVVVDTATNLGDVTLAAIDTCDLLILLTSQDIPAIKNARLFLDLTEVLNFPRQRVLFTMNKYDRRIGITPEKVGESFKQEITAVIPVDERIVIPSINRGIPFILGDKSRPVARALLTLAEATRQRLAEASKALAGDDVMVKRA